VRAIDLFAGAGGFTEGATQAGVHVVWAANHWALAVEAHALNHPATEHACQDLRQADWTALPHASVGVQRRIAKGRRNCGARFLTQHVTGHPGVPLCESIRTITTKDQWALVDGDRYRPLTVRETARAMGFRDSYRWPERATRRDRITGYGNAVAPPVATALVARVAEQIERSAA